MSSNVNVLPTYGHHELAPAASSLGPYLRHSVGPITNRNVSACMYKICFVSFLFRIQLTEINNSIYCFGCVD